MLPRPTRAITRMLCKHQPTASFTSKDNGDTIFCGGSCGIRKALSQRGLAVHFTSSPACYKKYSNELELLRTVRHIPVVRNQPPPTTTTCEPVQNNDEKQPPSHKDQHSSRAKELSKISDDFGAFNFVPASMIAQPQDDAAEDDNNTGYFSDMDDDREEADGHCGFSKEEEPYCEEFFPTNHRIHHSRHIQDLFELGKSRFHADPPIGDPQCKLRASQIVQLYKLRAEGFCRSCRYEHTVHDRHLQH